MTYKRQWSCTGVPGLPVEKVRTTRMDGVYEYSSTMVPGTRVVFTEARS